MKILVANVLVFSLGAVAFANPAPLQSQASAHLLGTIDIGIDNLGPARDMRERNYFEAQPSVIVAPPRCRLEHVLFSANSLARSCR
jgi:hypothetical protein